MRQPADCGEGRWRLNDMKDGFCRVCAVTPELAVTDVRHNVEEIKSNMKAAAGDGC